MPNNQSVTVTLPVDSWQAIMNIIEASCEPKDANWVHWGESVNRIILQSISGPAQNNSSQQEHRRQYISARDELDYDYHDEEPYEEYTSRDLQDDLGMDFMSHDEFDSWLDDQG